MSDFIMTPTRNLDHLPAGPTSVEAFRKTSTEEVKFTHTGRGALSDRTEKALKNDDAQAPEELWNGFLMLGLPGVVKSPRLASSFGCTARFLTALV
jgi:hypothetical protein